MAVILDANALINLYRADILSLIYHRTECIVPAELYEEVVVGGRQAGHQDADEIAAIINPPVAPPTRILPEVSGSATGKRRYSANILKGKAESAWGKTLLSAMTASS